MLLVLLLLLLVNVIWSMTVMILVVLVLLFDKVTFTVFIFFGLWAFPCLQFHRQSWFSVPCCASTVQTTNHAWTNLILSHAERSKRKHGRKLWERMKRFDRQVKSWLLCCDVVLLLLYRHITNHLTWFRFDYYLSKQCVVVTVGRPSYVTYFRVTMRKELP
jgi:hypothetical protein